MNSYGTCKKYVYILKLPVYCYCVLAVALAMRDYYCMLLVSYAAVKCSDFRAQWLHERNTARGSFCVTSWSSQAQGEASTPYQATPTVQSGCSPTRDHGKNGRRRVPLSCCFSAWRNN
eukprot:4661250-Pleurochrysis_carterae.AAC.3